MDDSKTMLDAENPGAAKPCKRKPLIADNSSELKKNKQKQPVPLEISRHMNSPNNVVKHKRNYNIY